MVPLESILRKPARHGDAIYVPPPPRPPKARAPAEPRKARTFKVIDVRSRRARSPKQAAWHSATPLAIL
jgi:hypothetical protein